MKYKIINIKDHEEYKDKAASFFTSKRNIEESEYLKALKKVLLLLLILCGI